MNKTGSFSGNRGEEVPAVLSKSDGMETKSDTSVFISVSEAAQQLGVNLPRLLRYLRREPFVAYLRKEDRKTRTGMRTVTLVSVSILSELKRALREENPQQKQKQFVASTEPVSPPVEDPRVPLLEALIREQRARISDLQEEKVRLLQERETLRQYTELLVLERDRRSATTETATRTGGGGGVLSRLRWPRP
ncbi:MAG: hypothetical protein SFU56_21475 [Capsulimonadales bacterium]|nr:hypothetical protein [Capsulimonadales bacterium]